MNDRFYRRWCGVANGQNEDERLQRLLLTLRTATITPISARPASVSRKASSTVPEKARSPNMRRCPHTRDDLNGIAVPLPKSRPGSHRRRWPNHADGMKLIVTDRGACWDNAIELVGYETLCIMIKDDPLLADLIFAEIGIPPGTLYQLVARGFCRGCISNDGLVALRPIPCFARQICAASFCRASAIAQASTSRENRRSYTPVGTRANHRRRHQERV